MLIWYDFCVYYNTLLRCRKLTEAGRMSSLIMASVDLDLSSADMPFNLNLIS